MRVLHILNYGWPFIDGYTIRSAGLLTAQQRELGWEPIVATAPYTPLTSARDEAFKTAAWRPALQISAAGLAADGSTLRQRSWERPSIGLSPVTDAMYESELNRIMDRVQPALIHAHHPHYSAGPACKVARRRGLPFIYEARCLNGDYDLMRPSRYAQLRGWVHNRQEYALAARADHVVTISNGLAERLRQHAPAQTVSIVRNAVDTTLFRSAVRAARAPGSRLRIGYASTFERMENIEALVRAIAVIREAAPAEVTNIDLVLAGTGLDWARIDGLVKSLSLSSQVTLAGFVPYGEMPNFYQKLDLFVVPRGDSDLTRHTTPLKPLEALACGCPVLSTDLPALRELFLGREDVRFVEPTSAGIAEGIRAFTAAPWAGSADVSDRAWSSEIRKYETIYVTAIEANARRPQRTASRAYS